MHKLHNLSYLVEDILMVEPAKWHMRNFVKWLTAE